jgi:transcriptional regulator with XRE-family HTH domain
VAGEKASPPSPPGLRLGRELKRLREAGGYGGRRGVEQVAARLEISGATIYRAEAGAGMRRERDVRELCALYGASPERAAALVELARQAKTPGWWNGYDIPAHLALYLGLEAAAKEIWWFEPLLAPGLLQTEDYARAIITAGRPVADGHAETAAKIAFRMERQSAALSRAERPPALQVVIGEEALRRPIGGASVQAEQLDRLLQAADMPNVSVRVVPVAAGMYQGVGTGPFEVLFQPPDTDGQTYEPPTVYAETFASAAYLDEPADVSRYTTAFEDIRSCALSDPDSRALIKSTTEELRA